MEMIMEKVNIVIEPVTIKGFSFVNKNGEEVVSISEIKKESDKNGWMLIMEDVMAIGMYEGHPIILDSCAGWFGPRIMYRGEWNVSVSGMDKDVCFLYQIERYGRVVTVSSDSSDYVEIAFAASTDNKPNFSEMMNDGNVYKFKGVLLEVVRDVFSRTKNMHIKFFGYDDKRNRVYKKILEKEGYRIVETEEDISVYNDTSL